MKLTYIKSILLLISMFLVLSCEDLDENPIGLLAPEGFYETPGDVQVGINGGYSIMGHEALWGRKLPLSILLRGDMATIGDMGTPSRRIEVDEMNMGVSNGMVRAFWPKGYEAIAALNYAIEGGETLDIAEEEINPIIAEGRFLRAFIHYHFVRLFGEIPYIDFAFSDPDLAYTLPQSSVEDVYAGIIEDLQYAKQWLPDVPVSRDRPGKGTAASFLASVHLTRENWDLAYQEAKYVIDNSGAFQYNLEGEFADLFDASLPASSNEVIWEINFIGGDASTNPGALGGTNAAIDYMAPVTGIIGDERFDFGAGWSVAVPSIAVFNDWDARDYRKAVSFDTVMVNGGAEVLYTDWGSIPSAIPRPHIAKYFRAQGQAGTIAGSNGRDSENDYILMRYAEILLIAAEAMNEMEQGPNAEAEDYVNQVRSRARRELDSDVGNDRTFPENVPSGLDVNGFRELVLEERRLELAFECGRWYDIQRKRMGQEAFGAGGLEQHAFNPARDYLFPKLQEDVDRNPNLDQNANY
ncbi:RagB/SusD family nutrient uptake outer membrane protein [Fulvivirga sp. M361]|uniref:RagB/SusD family nutrient uptake outer membrane protein n=1 Tax=Fulvivirga sp. M361 TaxID=2594266 RepID=UPI00117BCFE6|nr:RagB/SusD family nutrient uptake outer membrane protein [Fulvivirga sp. M361]TRX60193.1 RagB/SusD family nutrient uptake outer membrane protein [Fulvivirga sp. M361]